MANTTSAKGNPASHRMSNPNLKAKRARCWAANEARKPKRRAENEARAKANATIRALGSLAFREESARISGDLHYWLTPHEQQAMKRRLVRDEKRAKGLLPPVGVTREQWKAAR